MYTLEIKDEKNRVVLSQILGNEKINEKTESHFYNAMTNGYDPQRGGLFFKGQLTLTATGNPEKKKENARAFREKYLNKNK
jgi:hypothetical protein